MIDVTKLTIRDMLTLGLQELTGEQLTALLFDASVWTDIAEPSASRTWFYPIEDGDMQMMSLLGGELIPGTDEDTLSLVETSGTESTPGETTAEVTSGVETSSELTPGT